MDKAKDKKWEEKLKSMSKDELIREAKNLRACNKANYEAYQELKEKFKILAVRYCYETILDTSSDMD